MSIFASALLPASNPADEIDAILKIVEENERLKNPEVLWPERIDEMEMGYLEDLKKGRSASEWRKIFEADFPVGGILPIDTMRSSIPAIEHGSELVVPGHFAKDAWRYSMGFTVHRPRTVVNVHSI